MPFYHERISAGDDSGLLGYALLGGAESATTLVALLASAPADEDLVGLAVRLVLQSRLPLIG